MTLAFDGVDVAIVVAMIAVIAVCGWLIWPPKRR